MPETTEPRWSIRTDVALTRRKRYHVVYDPQGEWAYSSRDFWDCVDYLDAECVDAYEVRASHSSRASSVPVLYVTKDPLKWQS